MNATNQSLIADVTKLKGHERLEPGSAGGSSNAINLSNNQIQKALVGASHARPLIEAVSDFSEKRACMACPYRIEVIGVMLMALGEQLACPAHLQCAPGFGSMVSVICKISRNAAREVKSGALRILPAAMEVHESR